jgi:hypothetical protein
LTEIGAKRDERLLLAAGIASLFSQAMEPTLQSGNAPLGKRNAFGDVIQV